MRDPSKLQKAPWLPSVASALTSPLTGECLSAAGGSNQYVGRSVLRLERLEGASPVRMARLGVRWAVGTSGICEGSEGTNSAESGLVRL